MHETQCLAQSPEKRIGDRSKYNSQRLFGFLDSRYQYTASFTSVDCSFWQYMGPQVIIDEYIRKELGKLFSHASSTLQLWQTR